MWIPEDMADCLPVPLASSLCSCCRRRMWGPTSAVALLPPVTPVLAAPDTAPLPPPGANVADADTPPACTSCIASSIGAHAGESLCSGR
jgi:hypothetical protein